MSRIKRLVRPETPASNWRAAVPAVALAVVMAGLAGCAQTAVGGQAAQDSAGGASTRPIAQFASCKKPEYTPEALARRAEGTVTLGFLVSGTGEVRQSSVRKSSGDASLDEAARLAIEKCRFTPATSMGKPVDAWVSVQYVWSLG